MTFSIDDAQLADLFVFDSESMTLKFEPKYEAELSKGNLCPDLDKVSLVFELNSDLLGRSSQEYQLMMDVD